MRFFFRLLCCALALQTIGIKAQSGQLVEITKATPVFEGPQRRAKVLADADPGSSFSVLELSPKKTWIYLMDEDGNKGWVPTDRTNYWVLQAPVKDGRNGPIVENKQGGRPKFGANKNKGKKQGSKIAGDENADDEENKTDEEDSGSRVDIFQSSKSMLGFVGRKAFDDPHGPYGFGVKVFVMAPLELSSFRILKVGFETGYIHQFGQKKGEQKGYTLPLRYKMLSKGENSSFVSGPDLGMLFMKLRPPSQRSKWKTSVTTGYSLGWIPRGSHFLLWLRPGFEFWHGRRFSVEGNMSWVF